MSKKREKREGKKAGEGKSMRREEKREGKAYEASGGNVEHPSLGWLRIPAQKGNIPLRNS